MLLACSSLALGMLASVSVNEAASGVITLGVSMVILALAGCLAWHSLVDVACGRAKPGFLRIPPHFGFQGNVTVSIASSSSLQVSSKMMYLRFRGAIFSGLRGDEPVKDVFLLQTEINATQSLGLGAKVLGIAVGLTRKDAALRAGES